MIVNHTHDACPHRPEEETAVRIRFVIGAACAVTAALAIGACGSSSTGNGSSSGSSSATSAVKAPAVTGPAFKVAAICSCSGPQAAALAKLSDVSSAWAASVNAGGGIGGHKVKMVTVDDGSNPATALKQVKDLIENQHVQAIVGDGSLVDNDWASYVSKAGVPVLGGLAPSLPFIVNPDWFATGANLPVVTVGVGALAKSVGKKTLGVAYCAETPLCKQLDPLAKGAAQLSGLGYASLSISGTAPNYTAQCLKLKGSGVDALVVADNASIVSRLTSGCAQQGYKPLTVSQTNTADTSWLKDPNFEGAVLASSNPNYTDMSNPGIKAFHDVLDKYAPGVTSGKQFSYDLIYPWIAGKLFEATVEAGSLTPSSTPAEVKAALYKIKGETLDSLAPPLTYTKGQPAFVPCYYGVAIKGGKFASLNSGKPTCLSTAQATGLQASLKALAG